MRPYGKGYPSRALLVVRDLGRCIQMAARGYWHTAFVCLFDLGTMWPRAALERIKKIDAAIERGETIPYGLSPADLIREERG